MMFSPNVKVIQLVGLLFIHLLLAPMCLAAEDGLARRPIMGWRSWNAYGANINQEIMEATSLAMVAKRDKSGKRTNSNGGKSLLDLGYDHLGLDDNWQAKGKGVAHTFHDSSGIPLINEALFPDMGKMVDKIKSLGLKAGWYHNNCIAREKNKNLWKGNDHYIGDVKATLEYGFESVKLDGCGAFMNLSLWYELFAEGRKNNMLIENCHWGLTVPTVDHCPYHFYRTSGDITNTWGSMFANLQSTRRFQDVKHPLSRPGCWAYPDMLETGRLGNFEEDKAHFAAWCIVSSPLILGLELVDDKAIEKVWPIISNENAIAINQDWAGHPGRLAREVKGKGGLKIQIWCKPLSNGAIAVLFLNNNKPYKSTPGDNVSIRLEEIGGVRGEQYCVIDLFGNSQVESALASPQGCVERLDYTRSLEGDPLTASDLQGRSCYFVKLVPGHTWKTNYNN